MSRALRQIIVRPGVVPYFSQPKRRGIFSETRRPKEKDPHSTLYHMINGTKILRQELVRWKAEMKEGFDYDPAQYYEAEIVPQFNFRKQEDRDKFHIVADSDWGLGYSKGEFTATSQNTGLFKGFLDTRVPKDGVVRRAGYVVLQGCPRMKSFLRQVYMDWRNWTHLIIRCRGDGRHYSINLHAWEENDTSWHTLYSYPLYTRGGPYWQITKIPFSKFFLTYQGQVQDKQYPVDLKYLTKIGIAIMDKCTGPFELEIDYIACTMAFNDRDEEFAYEKYETPNHFSPYAAGMN